MKTKRALERSDEDVGIEAEGSLALPGQLLDEDVRMWLGSVLSQGLTAAFEEGKRELDAWMATRAGL